MKETPGWIIVHQNGVHSRREDGCRQGITQSGCGELLSMSNSCVHVCVCAQMFGLPPFLLAQLKLENIPPTLHVTRHFISQGKGGGENFRQLTASLRPSVSNFFTYIKELKTREGNKVAKVTQQQKRFQSKFFKCILSLS